MPRLTYIDLVFDAVFPYNDLTTKRCIGTAPNGSVQI